MAHNRAVAQVVDHLVTLHIGRVDRDVLFLAELVPDFQAPAVGAVGLVWLVRVQFVQGELLAWAAALYPSLGRRA